MSKEYGSGAHPGQARVTKLELTTLATTPRPSLNGGTDTKDKKQFSSMISILTASRTTLRYGRISIHAQANTKEVCSLYSTIL